MFMYSLLMVNPVEVNHKTLSAEEDPEMWLKALKTSVFFLFIQTDDNKIGLVKQ